MNYILQFQSLTSLIGFFYSTDMSEEELGNLPVKKINENFWVSSNHLGAVLNEDRLDRARQIAALYPHEVAVSKPTPSLQKTYQSGKDFLLSKNTLLLSGEKLNPRQGLTDQEFLIAVSDREQLKWIVNLFFELNHTNIRVATVSVPDFNYSYLLWVEGFSHGVPVALSMKEHQEKEEWALLYKIKNTPSRQHWFIPLGHSAYLPTLQPNLTQTSGRSEQVIIVWGDGKLPALTTGHFAPILNYTALKVEHLAPAVGINIPLPPESFKLQLKLEEKDRSDWELDYRRHNLDKKYEELNFQLERIRKIMQQFSNFSQIQRHSYLYCYNLKEDDRNFRRILRERPMIEKQGLAHYRSRINGLPGDRYNILVSNKLLSEFGKSSSNTPEGKVVDADTMDDHRWNITQEYLPINPTQYYYLQPEWFFAGIFMFVPLSFELRPYIDLTQPDLALKLVRAIFPSDISLKRGKQGDDQLRQFIDEHLFLLTPDPRKPGGIMPTYIKWTAFNSLDESYAEINADRLYSVQRHLNKLEEESAQWITEELQSHIGEKLKTDFEQIKRQSAEVRLNAVQYEEKMQTFKQRIQEELVEGRKLTFDIRATLNDLKKIKKEVDALRNRFEKQLFDEKDDVFLSLDIFLKKADENLSNLAGTFTEEERERSALLNKLHLKKVQLLKKASTLKENYDSLADRLEGKK